MADKAISDLTQALQIANEDLFVLEQNGEAKKLKGETLLDFVTLSVVSVTVTTLPAGSSATATYDKSTGTLALGIPQGNKGDTGATGATGPANVLTIGSVTSGKVASATITGEAPNQVLNLVLEKGDKGDTGEKGATGDPGPQGDQGIQGPQGSPGADAPTITNITIRQSDYHLIVTLSDGTSYDAGYCRGASGAGTGDMLAATYDPQGKAQDIFAYADAKYSKPSGGIPKTDLASDVQTSLGKADSALQSVTKSDVGLGNVDNVKQYSANNPPPYPVTSVNGKTGVVTVSVPTIPSTASLLKGNGSGGMVAATRGSDYIASGNIVKQTLVATETTPTEDYAINWVYG